MKNSCVDDHPLFHEGSMADRARAFLKELHSVSTNKWTPDDKKKRWSAIIAIQWARKKTHLARFNPKV